MFLCQSRGDLKAGTEITAAQDQSLQTKYHATKILQTETNSKYKLCQQFGETVDNIVRMFNIGKEQYMTFNIYKEIELKLDTEHWYEHAPKLVKTNHASTVTILWNQQVQTDRSIPYDILDIIIHYNEKGTYTLTDFRRQNVIKKEAEKILKYKNLAM